jgi:integrase
MTQGKRGRRAWFSPEEYKQLYTATRKRITDGGRPGWKSHYEDMHDYVLFMANTGLRPDEAARIEFRDVAIEHDPATEQTILVIDVRGKTGVGFCKSMPGAVEPFRRLKARREKELNDALPPNAERQQLKPTDRVFRKFNRDMFNQILREEGLKTDRDGKQRTAYSLRHTYISTRLMEGANIHQIANNCRTSVKMIEEFYASHIKDRIDAGAINMKRPISRRPRRSTEKPDTP